MSKEIDPQVKEVVARMFEGRKGHGGGPCTRRVLSATDLELMFQAVYEAGQQSMPHLLDWILDHLTELRVTTNDPAGDKLAIQARYLCAVDVQPKHFPWAPGERIKLVSALWRLIKRKDKSRAEKMQAS
jgi:hypothetical protein